MARVSRSSKKQPAFDPSELEDLIFSPAVGKGVGSHLVRDSEVTTVVTPDMTPVVTEDMATVVTPDVAPMDIMAPGVTSHLPTVVRSPNTSLLPDTVNPPPQPKLWITENGDLIAEGRVRKIRLAQDVINSAEENVYDTLWNAKLLQTDERDSSRIVQAGYDYLVKRTRLARKTIQRIVAKLLEKDFIAIENRADIYLRSATVYRVFSYKTVLEKHIKKGRLYVAKMGPGFSYAKPLESPLNIIEPQSDMTTVVTSQLGTGVKTDVATMVNETTVTVVKIDRPTVVKMSPHLLDTDVLDKTSSSAIRQELGLHHTPVDDDVVGQLISRCRQEAPDCTEEEILYFIREKSALIRKRKGSVYNPLGFLMTAVPRCFAPENLKAHRQEVARRRQGEALSEVREQAAMERWRREQEDLLYDPSVSEQEKHLIRLCLGLNTS